MATQVPPYTAAEVREFDVPGLRFEVIRGELFVTPAPRIPHQLAVMEFAVRLYEYLKTHNLGDVVPAPFEVELTEDSAVQPDILVILEEQRRRLTDERLYGAPALAIEVISYSSRRTDRIQKRKLYQDEGVPEYWIVDTEQSHVERWRPGDETPEILTHHISWQPEPGVPALRINLWPIFERTSGR